MAADGEITANGLLALLAAFVVTFFQLGSMKGYGVLVPQLIEHLSMDAWQVGLAGGIWIGLRALLGPLWAALANTYSYRIITVLGGSVSTVGILCAGLSHTFFQLNFSMVLIGVGHGLPLVAKTLVLRDYFQSNFGLASGIAFLGGAIGMVVFAPLMELGIRIYGWRGMMFIFGALNLHISVVGCLMVKPTKTALLLKTTACCDHRNSKDNTNIVYQCFSTLYNRIGLDIFHDYPIISIYLSAFGLHAIALSGWMVFLVSYATSLDYSDQQASCLSSMAGRIICAPLVSKKIITGKSIFIIFAVGGALSLVSYPFTDSYWLLSIIATLTGLFISAAPPIFIVILYELFPDNCSEFSSAVGLHYMARGIGRLVGGPLTGWLYDLTGDFHIPFIILAAIEGIVVILTIIIQITEKYLMQNRQRFLF